MAPAQRSSLAPLGQGGREVHRRRTARTRGDQPATKEGCLITMPSTTIDNTSSPASHGGIPMQAEATRRLNRYRKACAVLLILAGHTLGTLCPVLGQAAAATKAIEDATAIKNLLEMKLAGSGIQVQVKPLPKGQFWVILTGKLETLEEATR